MVSNERRQELLKGLYDAVVSYDEEVTARLSKAAVEEDMDAYDVIMNGLAAGMKHVGELYDSKEYFVPEVLLCSDAMYAGLDILKPHIKIDEAQKKVTGQIVIGVIQGDVHDIGKNLVAMMFEAAGWIVHDLGRDVLHEKFVEEAVKTGSEVVGMSALMTTSMLGMPRAIEMLREACPDIIIIIGGAPINPDVAERYKSDGYARNAGTAVGVAAELLKQRRERLGQ